MANDNRKKILAEQLKAKLNSPDYVAMPDLITHHDCYGDMSALIHGSNIHKKKFLLVAQI